MRNKCHEHANRKPSDRFLVTFLVIANSIAHPGKFLILYAIQAKEYLRNYQIINEHGNSAIQ